MQKGTPIARQYLLVTNNGLFVIDWGNGQFQDINTGQLLSLTEADISYTAQDNDLEILRHGGLISQYNALEAIFTNLPDRPMKMID